MKKPGKIHGFALFACILISFLTEPTRGNAQIIEMKIELPSLFSLQCLPEHGKEPAIKESPGNRDTPQHWLEITGDENMGIIVRINQEKDTVREYYINTGVFHADDAIPFKNKRASFILNTADGSTQNRSFFKAWIGLCDDMIQLTVDYL